jgi:hypothetical protein
MVYTEMRRIRLWDWPEPWNEDRKWSHVWANRKELFFKAPEMKTGSREKKQPF